jgi:hypothetical protein
MFECVFVVEERNRLGREWLVCCIFNKTTVFTVKLQVVYPTILLNGQSNRYIILLEKLQIEIEWVIGDQHQVYHQATQQQQQKKD